MFCFKCHPAAAATSFLNQPVIRLHTNSYVKSELIVTSLTGETMMASSATAEKQSINEIRERVHHHPFDALMYHGNQSLNLIAGTVDRPSCLETTDYNL